MPAPTSMLNSSVTTVKRTYKTIVKIVKSPLGQKTISLLMTVLPYLLERKGGTPSGSSIPGKISK